MGPDRLRRSRRDEERPGTLPGRAFAARRRRATAIRKRAEDFARRHGVSRWHDDADAIIRAPDVDIVYVATMTESHRDFVLRCAAAGKPVLTEKPMAMSHADCLAMIAACREANVPLWVAYYRRALPRFLKVRDLVQSGAIGDVRMVITPALPAHPDARGNARPVLGLAARSRALGRRHLLRGGGPHARHPRLHLRADRGGARVRRTTRRVRTRRRTSSRPRTDSRRASTAAAHGASPPIATRSTTRSSAQRGASVFDVSAAVAPAGRPPVPIRLYRGDTVEEIPGRRSALRAPAADPDHRRRDERNGPMSQHRRNRRPHRAGDRGLSRRVQRRAQALGSGLPWPPLRFQRSTTAIATSASSARSHPDAHARSTRGAQCAASRGACRAVARLRPVRRRPRAARRDHHRSRRAGLCVGTDLKSLAVTGDYEYPRGRICRHHQAVRLVEAGDRRRERPVPRRRGRNRRRVRSRDRVGARGVRACRNRAWASPRSAAARCSALRGRCR